MQNNPPRDRECSSIMSEAIDIRQSDVTEHKGYVWHVRIASSHLPAAAESREVKRTRGHVIAMLYSHVFLHGISLLKLSFCSPSHLYFITARPFYLFQSLLHLLPLVQPLSPSSLYHHFCLPSRLLSVCPDISVFSKQRSEASCSCLIWAVSSALTTTRRDSDGLGRVCEH